MALSISVRRAKLISALAIFYCTLAVADVPSSAQSTLEIKTLLHLNGSEAMASQLGRAIGDQLELYFFGVLGNRYSTDTFA
jgi:hypothetical protein